MSAYLLDEEKLEKGDIILLKFETEKSKLIRRFAESKYSHAMLYVGGSSLIDADGPGVHAHNLQRLIIPSKEDILVLRPKNATKDQIWNVEQFVRSKVGTEYSMEEARKVVRNGEFVPEDNRQFCTRLVAKAYEHAGLHIVPRPDYCSPKDIEDSEEFNSVEEPIRVADEKEIIYANEADTPLQKQEEITNALLENVRALTTEDIQTLEQIDDYLIAHPEHNLEITRIISESGYLSMWELDINRNPWHYNFKDFENHYPEVQYANTGKWLVNLCKELFVRYTLMLQHYETILQGTKLKYFEAMRELYTKLLQLNRQRLEVAMDAMIEAGLSEEEIAAAGAF